MTDKAAAEARIRENFTKIRLNNTRDKVDAAVSLWLLLMTYNFEEKGQERLVLDKLRNTQDMIDTIQAVREASQCSYSLEDCLNIMCTRGDK